MVRINPPIGHEARIISKGETMQDPVVVRREFVFILRATGGLRGL